MRRSLLCSASALSALVFALPAAAQQTQQPPQPGSTSSTGTSTTGKNDIDGSAPATGNEAQADRSAINADGTVKSNTTDVVVTGSRIRLPNLRSFEPTLTVGREYFQERNLTNAADALNEQPQFRGSITPNGGQGSFGQGVNFVNNFGLGSNRTLTLVNGRRFVSSAVPTQFGQTSGPAGQVDLNVIPTILIDRIDNIDVGGAPVYGSDAISGVVNFILRDRFKGVEASALSGITERGDGFRYNVSLLAGHDYMDGRANITFAVQHDYQRGILYNARDFLRANIGGATNPSTAQAAALGRPAGVTYLNDGRVNTGIGFNDSATDGFPGTVQVYDRTIPLLTTGGLITAAFANLNGTGSVPGAVQNFQFDPSGNLVPFNRGIRFLGATEASGGDGFRFNDFSQITSNLRRDIGTVFAHFDASDALKFFMEGEVFNSRGDQLVQQPSFNSSLFSGLSGPLTFTNTSPFLTAQAKAQLAALGVTRFQVSRASVDLADLSGFSTTTIGRGVLGARGDFTLLGGRKFNYEVSGTYGRNVTRDTRQDINAQNFVNAVNVTTNASGQIVCTATPTVLATPGRAPVADPNCVPLNLLGFGRSSPAARAYVIAQNDTYSVLEQKVFNANVGGSPFSLFGNDQAFNVGYEHREESGSFRPSNFQQLGLGRSAAVAPLSGKFKVDEFFGEAQVTLVSPVNDLSFLNRLELFGRARHVQNTVNGGFLSFAAGGRIAPVRDIQFRGNYTKSFRTPSITELFLPVSPGFATVPDLCSPANRNAGAAPATRARNCAAFLSAFPNATPLDAASATVPSLSGGNTRLQNEVARSFTYGVVLQPRFIPGLSVTADYIDIRIANPISNLSVATITSACFDNADFNTADPANGNSFCSQIKRYTAAQGGTAANGGSRAGQVVNDPANPGVTSGFVNGKRIFFSGIEGTVDYTTELAGLGIPGRFGTSTTVLYVRRRVVDITGVAPVRTDGIFGDPKFSSQTNIRYANDDFGMSASVNVVGRQIATRTGLSPDLREFNVINAFATVNGSIYINVQKEFRLTFAVTNIGDRIGQKYFGTYPLALTNDLFGRRFSVSARANF